MSQPRLKTATFSQMGGEGLQWVGAAPFSETGHIFQNLGDGTYQHSGLLAIRAAVAAKANITFKILYNDAVAMTGGQPAEGAIDPARISRQLAAEGVDHVHLVSDDPDRWRAATGLAEGVTIAHRDDLDQVQRRLREAPASPRSSTNRPARPRSAAAASAATSPTPTGASSSTRASARAAATARSSRTASRSSRWRPASAASAGSTSRAATRTSPASRASARASSRSRARCCASPTASG
ncbi:thiamine pyrophosphate-dependent enzyme [Rhizorhabdus histidinilytica]